MRNLYAYALLFFAATVIPQSAIAQSPDLQNVLPPDGAQPPQNARVFFTIPGGEPNRAATIRVQQEGEDSSVTSSPLSCVGACTFEVQLPELLPGSATITVGTEFDEPHVVTWDVRPEPDETPPEPEPPSLSVRGRYGPPPFKQLLNYRIEIENIVAQDDHGVALVIVEANTDEARSDDEFFAFATFMADEVPLSTTNVLPPERRTACARVTAVDWAGNRATSDPTCVQLQVELPTVDVPPPFNRFLQCSCGQASTVSGTWPQVGGALGLAVVLLATRRQRPARKMRR